MCMDDCDSILIVCICWCMWVIIITVHEMNNIKFWKKNLHMRPVLQHDSRVL